MKHLLMKAVAGSGLLMMTLTASAQYQPRRDYQDRDRIQDPYHDRLFERLRSDLDRAHASTVPETAERDRVIRAEERVDEYQRMINSGDFDRRMFDATIAAVQQVVDMNRLPDDSRGLLVDDIRALSRLEGQLEQ